MLDKISCSTFSWNTAMAMKLLYAPDPPYNFACGAHSILQRTEHCSHAGSDSEIVDFIFRAASVSFELVKLVSAILWNLRNQLQIYWQPVARYAEFLDLMENGTVDSVVSKWLPLESRLDRFTASDKFPDLNYLGQVTLFVRNSAVYIIHVHILRRCRLCTQSTQVIRITKCGRSTRRFWQWV